MKICYFYLAFGIVVLPLSAMLNDALMGYTGCILISISSVGIGILEKLEALGEKK